MRFVVHHHILAGGSHWDLMFEAGAGLATWRSPVPLAQVDARPVAIERIGDHRLAYLSYEGPVSGDRGRVEIHETGTYETLDVTEREWRIRVSGSLTHAAFLLCSSGGASGEWTIRRTADEVARPNETRV
ncbi:MAG: hypothetical protein HUU22_18425 [Phycisphaerae bacterium]|nr:hypothetical protein [Phycisphaerae bacterium]NUQ47992.1 hypothetical protein [Phycisphaerae bacterium]